MISSSLCVWPRGGGGKAHRSASPGLGSALGSLGLDEADKVDSATGLVTLVGEFIM